MSSPPNSPKFSPEVKAKAARIKEKVDKCMEEVPIIQEKNKPERDPEFLILLYDTSTEDDLKSLHALYDKFAELGVHGHRFPGGKKIQVSFRYELRHEKIMALTCYFGFLYEKAEEYYINPSGPDKIEWDDLIAEAIMGNQKNLVAKMNKITEETDVDECDPNHYYPRLRNHNVDGREHNIFEVIYQNGFKYSKNAVLLHRISEEFNEYDFSDMIQVRKYGDMPLSADDIILPIRPIERIKNAQFETNHKCRHPYNGD